MTTICRNRIPWRFSGNVLILLMVAFIVIVGELGLLPNKRIGFFCDDPKISYKYEGDTITACCLALVTTFLPLLVMYANEWANYSPDSYKSMKNNGSTSSNARNRLLWEWYGYYILGTCYLLFVIEIIKVIVGEPRPHFLDSCRPQECLGLAMENFTHEYKRDYTCTNTEYSWLVILDSDKSFPSGHSGISMFTAVFLTWYLQIRVPDRLVLVLVKPWLQCMTLLWGVCCSASRLTDHRHFWWDIMVGASMGTLFALFTIRVLCRGFRRCEDFDSVIIPELGLANGTPIAAAIPVDPATGQLVFESASGKRLIHVGGSRKLLVEKSSSGETVVNNGGSVDGRELGDMTMSWNA